jgi:hypothetical protein
MADDKLPFVGNVTSYGPTIGTHSVAYGAQGMRSMCVHALDQYTLSDGSVVYLSGAFDERFRDWSPDVGFYLDGKWDDVSTSFSYLIPWQDYGLPLPDMATVIRYARSVIEHCDNGETVEIGCLGSHGRTGTFVAVLEIVASNGNLSARDAIAKVRAEHCFKCVETEMQEWYVKAIRATIRGETLPKRPRVKKTVLPKATVHQLPLPVTKANDASPVTKQSIANLVARYKDSHKD